MGCWGLLGWLFIVIVDHSRKFPAFSTSKKIEYWNDTINQSSQGVRCKPRPCSKFPSEKSPGSNKQSQTQRDPLYTHPSVDISHLYKYIYIYGGSWNRGIPKSSILMRFSTVNHPAIGVPPFMETFIYTCAINSCFFWPYKPTSPGQPFNAGAARCLVKVFVEFIQSRCCQQHLHVVQLSGFLLEHPIESATGMALAFSCEMIDGTMVLQAKYGGLL